MTYAWTIDDALTDGVQHDYQVEAEVKKAKIQELKEAEADAETKKASGKQKLLDLGLSEEEVKALIGV
jgi:uncharacterized protein involved in outer membrane biogenesis